MRNARFDAAEVSRPYDVDSESASTVGSSIGSSIDDKLSTSAGSFSSVTPTSQMSRAGTPKLGYFDDVPEPVTHCIIIPDYKEDMDTMKETLSVLGSHVLARSSYDVS